MSAEAKRSWVADLYPGPKWKKKVRKMSDAQIFAIWTREHNKNAKPKPKPKEKPDDTPF